DPEDKKQLSGNFEVIVSDLQKGNLTDAYHVFAAEIMPDKNGLLDYLQPDGIVIFDDYSRLLDKENDVETQNAEWLTEKLKAHSILPDTQLSVDVRTREQNDKHPQIFLSLFQKGMGNLRFNQILDIKARAVQQFF